jgi:glycosyltransferase involved in cell wall biosynthesis
MDPLISVVVNAYLAQPALDRQIALWRQYPDPLRQATEFVVVDDGSQPPLQALPAPSGSSDGLALTLARIQQDIPWNMPGARNLGALLARGRWLLFHDLDHFLPAASLQLLLQHQSALEGGTLYRFARMEDGEAINSHINSFLCARDAFWRAGGYDEDFAGHYGHEDACLLAAWQARVGPMVLLNDVWLEVDARMPTPGLSRDTTRNSELLRQKTAAGHPVARSRLRFDWQLQARA